CIGMDFSKGMIKQSKIFLKKRNLKANLVIGISANLPFKNESVSTVICNAVLHDIIQKEDISRSLKEIRRVAKNNCEVLMSVWNRCQKRFIWPLIKSFFSGNYADIWVDWNYHGKIYKRFYHLYTKKELRNEIEKVELKVEKGWNDEKGNIWLLITKWE
ncbi:MAG: class I SAM-dependent methyltransferase, partial [Candidatus Aenigmarchaeota archaeon]|nr:class I SAM-dependent methyltransferase [Candidatus Aenigmarchaeota archaeon]